LRSHGLDAESNIREFINASLEEYKQMLKESGDKSRYFFRPIKSNTAAGPSDPRALAQKRIGYKKHLLSEHKTFDSIFFPEKEKVLSTLEKFLQKKGQFAIRGFPNKLGLLLHGPPGTGKTSLIKCVAHWTRRHIVEVPLSQIQTNQELFDAMFGLKFHVPSDDDVVCLKFSDIVFVMEDIDAASDIVYRRQGARQVVIDKPAGPPDHSQLSWTEGGCNHCNPLFDKAMVRPQARPNGRIYDSQINFLKASGTTTAGLLAQEFVKIQPQEEGKACEVAEIEGTLANLKAIQEGVNQIMETTDIPTREDELQQFLDEVPAPPQLERSKSAPPFTKDLVRLISFGSDAQAEEGQVEQEEEEEEEEQADEEPSGLSGMIKDLDGRLARIRDQKVVNSDKLNLAGLLNVLDGVVDSPGRILIMTTNFPDKLDDALIRPGRVNFSIKLGYMRFKEMRDLINMLLTPVLEGEGRESQGALTELQDKRIRMLARQGRVTPAMLEQCAMECPDLDALLEKLERRQKMGVKA